MKRVRSTGITHTARAKVDGSLSVPAGAGLLLTALPARFPTPASAPTV